MDFARLYAGHAFHAEELRRCVLIYEPEIAPDSPGRILRLLRQEGKLNYVVINRRNSLYQFRPDFRNELRLSSSLPWAAFSRKA